MTAIRAITAALALAVIGSSLQAIAQDNPYVGLRQYDYQDRRSVMTIRRAIQAAGQDKSKQAAIEAGLIGVLNDPSSNVAGKQEAARLLWMVASAKSVTALAKLLPDPEMNNIARYGLERNADPSAAAALRSALTTTKGTALVGVINSVGNRGDAAAVSALRKLATSSDPLVSDAAITALGKVGTAASVAALRSLPAKGLAVDNALLRCAAKLAANAQRPTAIALYQSLTAASYPAVIRAGALQGLKEHGAPQTGRLALSTSQTATDPNLQRVSASIAALVTTPAVVQSIVAAFPKLPPTAQVAILSAWSDRLRVRRPLVYPPVVTETAMRALRSDNPAVRSAAAQAASVLAGARAVPTLAEMAAGGDQAQVARESLAQMSGPGVDQALIGLLNSGRPEVKTAVVNILAERPSPASTSALIAAAGGSDTRIAAESLKALGRMGASDHMPRMVEILVSTKNGEVRDAAQTAIVAVAQRMGDRNRAAGPLLDAYSSASTASKASLLGALAEVGGDRALDVITQATASPEAEIHGAALNALANTWSDSSALPALLKLSRDGANRSDRIIALRGYLRLVGADDRAPGSERLARIREAMAVAERPEEKRQALSVLRNVRTTEAVEMAAAALDDPQLVAEASDAILYLASKQRRNNRDIQPVTGPAVQAALDKVIRTVNDESVKQRAVSLRQG
jgi:HEAT repeat protein